MFAVQIFPTGQYDPWVLTLFSTAMGNRFSFIWTMDELSGWLVKAWHG